MERSLIAVRKQLVNSPEIEKGRSYTLAPRYSPVGPIVFTLPKATMVLVLLSLIGFGAQLASAQCPNNNNVVTVDGTECPFTAAGVQTAINQASTLVGNGGTGAIVQLPAATIQLGSTGITLNTHVCLIGQSSDSSWLSYSGTGAAVAFASNTMDSCLRHVTIALVSGAGANAIGLNMQTNYSDNMIDEFAKIQDVTISASTVAPGQIGINLQDESSPQAAPSGIQLSWFDTIDIINLGQPIVALGGEGNFWSNIHISGFSCVALNDSLNGDNFWQLRITGPATSSTAVGIQETGRTNHFRLDCNFSQAGQTCIDDTGLRNLWEVTTLAPVGTVTNNSFLNELGSTTGNIPSNFQVANAGVTTASSTIRSSGAACLEMGNSDGSAGTNYVTFSNGAISVSTSQPPNCP
jgi:hypothetical protein